MKQKTGPHLSDYGFLEIEVADSIEISVRSKNSLYVPKIWRYYILY
jgi:hypothetical protein